MEIQKKVRGYLKELGITFNLTGYSYIIDAMEIIYQNPTVLRKGITSTLYPMIAKKYDVVPKKIDRCIRHAAVLSLNNIGNDVASKYFSNAISYESGTVTNAQFLACLYTKLMEDLEDE